MILKQTITLFLLLALASCKGQFNTEKPNETADRQKTLGTEVDVLDENVWAIFQDSKQNYWFGSNGHGVIRYDGKKLIQYTDADGLVNNTIRGIQEDKKGNIYIQTNGGISQFDGNSFTTLKLISDTTNEWKLKPNDLWFNYDNRLCRYDGTSLFELTLPEKDLDKAFGTKVVGLSFKDMNHSPYAVYGINKDKAGNLWIGTITAGVYRYDGASFLWIPEKELSTLPDGRVPGVRSIIEDKNGFFWLSNFISKYKISENESVVSYEKLEGIDPNDPLFEGRIGYFNSGLEASNGDLWMTTYGSGAWKYDGEVIINFPVNEQETEGLSLCIHEDSEGVIWIGTQNVGVFRFNGKSFEKFEPNSK